MRGAALPIILPVGEEADAVGAFLRLAGGDALRAAAEKFGQSVGIAEVLNARPRDVAACGAVRTHGVDLAAVLTGAELDALANRLEAVTLTPGGTLQVLRDALAARRGRAAA